MGIKNAEFDDGKSVEDSCKISYQRLSVSCLGILFSIHFRQKNLNLCTLIWYTSTSNLYYIFLSGGC
jgi:hypothetical protein